MASGFAPPTGATTILRVSGGPTIYTSGTSVGYLTLIEHLQSQHGEDRVLVVNAKEKITVPEDDPKLRKLQRVGGFTSRKKTFEIGDPSMLEDVHVLGVNRTLSRWRASQLAGDASGKAAVVIYCTYGQVRSVTLACRLFMSLTHSDARTAWRSVEIHDPTRTTDHDAKVKSGIGL